MSKRPKESTKEDVVVVVGKATDGPGVQVLRKRQEEVTLAEIRPMKDGTPIQGEVVRLHPRREENNVFDVESVYVPPAAEKPAGTGPAKVASDSYREGWDRIFSSAKAKSTTLH